MPSAMRRRRPRPQMALPRRRADDGRDADLSYRRSGPSAERFIRAARHVTLRLRPKMPMPRRIGFIDCFHWPRNRHTRSRSTCRYAAATSLIGGIDGC